MNEKTISPTDRIIRKNMIWAMGAGAIPVPVADVVAVTAIQLDMLKELCSHYEAAYAEQKGKSIVTALTSSIMARYAASAIKSLPGLGSIIGGVSMVVMSGASTYAIGHLFDKYLSEEGSFDSINMDEAKVVFKDAYKKGKKVAKKLKEELKKEEKVA